MSQSSSEVSSVEPVLLSDSARWLVLSKPPGWLSVLPMSGVGDGRPILSEWLRERRDPVFPVHRLDFETSGVILFAKDRDAHREASVWFQSRKVTKTYYALAEGEPGAPTIRITEPVAGRPSTSQIEIKERFAGAFLAAVTPRTGRRHQIRIHLAARGHPILGDLEYGGSRLHEIGGGARLEVVRVALHAWRLQLPTGEVFEAPWPTDFTTWLESLRAAPSKAPDTVT